MMCTTTIPAGNSQLHSWSNFTLISYRKSLAIALCFFGILANVQAQEANLGRLFSTPTERASLDKLRLQNKLGEQATIEEPATITTTPPPQLFTHNGFVKRSNGTETTWINQVPSEKQKNTANIRVKQQLSKVPTVSVMLPSGKRQELKVGQSFDLSTSKVREVYEVPPSSKTDK